MPEILLIGDERERAESARSILRQDGHQVTWVRDVTAWREAERKAPADLIIAAVASAEPVLGAPGRPARGFPPPILFVQHGADAFRDVHLEERIVDRIESPFMAEEFLGRVDALIRVRRIVLRDGRTEPPADRVGPGVRGWMRKIGAAMGRRVPPFPRIPAPYLEVAARVAEWTDRRDAFEPGHAERVASLCAMIADGFGLPDNEAAALLRAAMLHDIGKVCLPVEVLRQRGPLDEEHMRLVRKHAERGAALLRALDPDEEVAAAIHDHHEQVDGKGYHGKRGSSISRSARILAVAEAYDAMTTSLVRDRLTSERAQGVLRDRRGGQFDADCVDALVDALRPRPRSVALSTGA